MKKKIVGILVFMLVFPTVAGAISSANTEIKSLNKASTEEGYSHNILGEFFTYTTCQPCKYAHAALKNLYKGGWHPFYYISMVYDKNKWAKQRHDELNVYASPTVVWDGGYRRDIGASDVQSAMTKYNTSIIKCGNRNVADIDLSLDVTWLGAVNPDPEDNETNVPIEQIMEWTVTAMDIDVTVDNNKASQYNGHLHVYVTEVNSTYWDDTWDYPYTFAFLDYAWNEDVTISGGGTWDDSTEWDGADHHNGGYGGMEYFDELYQDNCMVIASIFDEDNNDYTDETAGFLAGVNTGPKMFDLYFGNTTPPPKILSNTSIREYDPPDDLEWNTTYYWKIDIWNNQGDPTYGDIWNFTTRDNNPPNTPYNPNPMNNSIEVPINTNLSWYGGDPDFDDVTYDVYFGDYFPPPKVKWNQTGTTYDPTPYGNNLEFNTKYYWRIVAWDEYNYTASGPNWSFTTQVNLPPDEPSDPFPEDGANEVDVNVTLRWKGGDPNPGDTVTYDFYFGPNDPPTIKKHNLTDNFSETPYDLTEYETYYWKIVSWDSQGLSTPGKIWDFTTGINYPPNAPTIDGPINGSVGVEYCYNFTATDPNGHDVKYYIKWGDGATNWTELYASGETVQACHTWTKKGTYNITARAQDEYGKDGKYGYLIVDRPVTINLQNSQQSSKLLFLQILERLLFHPKLIK